MDTVILGRYRLVERLAVGGSAEVWRAHDVQLDRAVAVKRPHPHLVPDAASRARLVAEARAAAQLSHPVIVDVYDVDPDGETPVIVMELVEGESLAARIARDGPLEPRAAASVGADVADALYHAHQRGVIHRDVKPGNVLLAADGRTRLVDFGIARLLAESAERLTLTGTVVGTLNTMAPEQLAGGEIGPRSDLYGLGVVIHEAFTGRPPYAATSPVALADAQRAGPPPLEAVDRAVAAVTAACLAYDAADRPVHAGAVASALRAWADGDSELAFALAAPVAASAVDTSAITQAIPTVDTAAPAAPAHPAETSGRARRVLPVALLAVLGSLAILAAVVLSGLAGDPGVAEDASPSPSPAPTLDAAWLADALERIDEECGGDTAEGASGELAALDSVAAAAYVDSVLQACADDGGGNGRGNGNGNGNGNGRGRGNDD